MDLATIGGLLLALASVGISYMIEGGRLGAVFILPAMMLVIGGTLGAATIGTSVRTLLNVPRLMRIALMSRERDPGQLIETIATVAD